MTDAGKSMRHVRAGLLMNAAAPLFVVGLGQAVPDEREVLLWVGATLLVGGHALFLMVPARGPRLAAVALLVSDLLIGLEVWWKLDASTAIGRFLGLLPFADMAACMLFVSEVAVLLGRSDIVKSTGWVVWASVSGLCLMALGSPTTLAIELPHACVPIALVLLLIGALLYVTTLVQTANAIS